MESDTPRTDTEVGRIENDEKQYEDRYDTYLAVIDFACQLERESHERLLEIHKIDGKLMTCQKDRDAWKKCAEDLAYIVEELETRFVGVDEVHLALGKYRQLKVCL